MFVFDFSFDISRRFRSSWGELERSWSDLGASWGAFEKRETRREKREENTLLQIQHVEGVLKTMIFANSAILGDPANCSKSSDLGQQGPIFSCNPHLATTFRCFFTPFAHRFMRQPPRHGRFGRFRVANPRSQIYRKSIENVEPAAQNGKNVSQNKKKGVLAASWGLLGRPLGSPGPSGAVLWRS